jgi:hypothetical protein
VPDQPNGAKGKPLVRATIPIDAPFTVFLGLFESYGGPWSARVSHATFAVLLMTFLTVNLVAALAAWLLWDGSKAGAVIAWRCSRSRPCSGSASLCRSPGCSASRGSS